MDIYKRGILLEKKNLQESQVDELIGLKENVIIGKLIPAGTGLSKYKNIHIDTEKEECDCEEECNN